MPTDDYREYAPADWPDVEVLVDDTWLEGELRAWSHREAGWHGHVQYRTGPAQNYLAVFPADHIRKVEPPC
jgi:hypothetical protein